MSAYKMDAYDKKVYAEELFDFLPDKIVDSHVHCCTIDHLYEHQKPQNNPEHWTYKVGFFCPINDLIKTYDTLFAGKKVVPVLLGQVTGKLDLTNKYAKKVMQKYNFPALYSTSYSMTEEFLEKEVVEGGFQGLKPYCYNCNPKVVGADADVYDFLPESHLKLADKYGLKVILHVSKRDRLKNPDNVKRLLEIEQKYPNVKLIVAHIGRAYCPEDIGDALTILGKNTKNMKFDFCGNVLDKALRECIEAVGTDRVIFGTDLPITKMKMYRICENGTYINVVPRGLYGDVSNDPHMRETDEQNLTNFVYENIRSFKRVAEDLTLSKEDIEKITYKTAAKLYDITF